MKFQIFFCLITASLFCHSQEPIYPKIATDIIQTAEKLHYAPSPIDDEFSVFVFEHTIKNIDPYYALIETSGLAELEKHRLATDQYLLAEQATFIEELERVIRLAFQGRIKELESLSLEQFNFKEGDVLEYNRFTNQLSDKSAQFKQSAFFQLDLLSGYFSTLDSTEASAEAFKAYRTENFERLQQDRICLLKKRFGDSSKLKKTIGEAYLKAVANAFDPHTSYFNPTENEQFRDELSTESLSYGIEYYKNDQNEFEIIAIYPGSSAWESNQLNEGDLLKTIRTEKQTYSGLKCMSEGELEQLLAASESATFTFEKSRGERIEIALEKRTLTVEDNVINSYILEHERKIGYIYLPSFYSSEPNGNYLPNGCANDIAKELLKLKRENIEGLILDVRNNGGGSMLEAIRMVGIFINQGAVAISDSRDEEPLTLKDMDRGMLFSKPLLVMVNSNSASASEFMAASLQDHHRAIIVGENTFGKATMQYVVPVNAHQYNAEAIWSDIDSQYGYLKITSGKFFRVDGSSHQNIGVTPDIQIYANSELKFREGDFESNLDNTSISKKTYYKPFPALPIDTLQHLSSERRKLRKKSALTSNKSLANIPLSFDGFNVYYQTAYQSEFEPTNQKLATYAIKRPSYLLGMETLSKIQKEVQLELTKQMQRDQYLQEAYFILTDLITIQNP